MRNFIAISAFGLFVAIGLTTFAEVPYKERQELSQDSPYDMVFLNDVQVPSALPQYGQSITVYPADDVVDGSITSIYPIANSPPSIKQAIGTYNPG